MTLIKLACMYILSKADKERGLALRIAIIGAGVSGLSCTYELEKYGVRPDLYEVQDMVMGRGFNHVAGWMNVMYRPIHDAIDYLKQEYGIVVKPMERVERVNFYSADNSATLTGKLGYILLMGPGKGSVYNQLLEHVRTPVKYSQVVNFRQLAKEYDHVVVATGTPEIPMVLGNWRTDIAGYVRGATVAGQFDPRTIVMWFNTRWAQRGYAYFVPWNDRKGSLILNMQETGPHGAKICWQQFLDWIGWDIEIVETYETTHNIGHVYQNRHSNLIFTGLAGGFVDPLFAFGQIASIASGAAAAKAIVEGAEFDKLVHIWHRRNRQLRMFRRYVDKFSDRDYDRALAVVKSPMFRTLLSRSNVNIIYILSKLANILVRHKIENAIT